MYYIIKSSEKLKPGSFFKDKDFIDELWMKYFPVNTGNRSIPPGSGVVIKSNLGFLYD